MKIPILLEKTDWLAVNKPIGISVHNPDENGNLISVLQEQLAVKKLYPVHRLDKETSGVQIIALNEKSAQILAQEFQSHRVEKDYTGVLRGKLKNSEGVWHHPITDKAEGRKNPAGLSQGRVPCETEFKIINQNNYFSYCSFRIHTGRQHQIRKHCAINNHTIVGDSRYGDPNYNKKISEIYKTNRMFLHSAKVRLLDNEIISLDDFSFLF